MCVLLAIFVIVKSSIFKNDGKNMSLLENLVTQVAKGAIQGQNQSNQNSNMGGMLGNVLTSVLSGNNQAASNITNANQSFGLNDVLGSVLGQSSSQNNGLGSILATVLGAQGNQAANNKNLLIAALLPVVLGWIQRNGGLSGALSKITNMGLDNQARSWVSNQSNDTLSTNDISQLFDSHEINQVATQTGTNENEVRQGLSELLPEVINQLTPNGDLQHESQANDEINQILSQLSSTLKNF